MRIRIISIGLAAALGAVIPVPATAQDAAETAVILSGQGGAARAQRSLGDAISQSINGAAGAIRNTNTGASNGGGGGSSSGGSGRSGGRHQGFPIPAGIDALEGFDAAIYRLDNGTVLKFSGNFLPSAGATCLARCAEG